MTSLNNILRNLITDCTEYCCLCFETVTEKCRSFNIRDEIMLELENVDDIYEMLFTVLGEEVINSLPTNTICDKCTEAAIVSYKFIEVCKNNILSLSCNINRLQNYVAYASGDYYCKSLYLAVDSVNNTINEFRDEKSSYESGVAPHERLQHLQSKAAWQQWQQNIIVCNAITLDMKYEHVKCIMQEEPALVVSTKSKVLTQKIKGNSCRKKSKYKPVLQSDKHSDRSNKNNDKNDTRCKDCLKEFKTVKILKLHYIRVHAPQSFKCSTCPRSYGSQFLLNRHIKASHSITACAYCSKIYYNTFSLKHHEKTHTTHLVCKNCGKAYKGRQAFNNHVQQKLCEKKERTVSEAKFTCNYCEKKYAQKSSLNVHKRLEHENGKAVICNWCGKKLSSESRLQEHIVKHTKQKNYQCDTCGEKVSTKTSLLYHIRTHTGETPYNCEYCDMKFLSASRRLEHVRHNHAGLDLECDICRRSFKGPTYLKRHRKRHFDVSSRLYHHQIKSNLDIVT